MDETGLEGADTRLELLQAGEEFCDSEGGKRGGTGNQQHLGQGPHFLSVGGEL